jgi:putative transposase
MKQSNLLAPQRPVQRDTRVHDGTVVTDKVDVVWDEPRCATGSGSAANDMTQTVTTQEGRAYVFIAVDHCSGEFVGTHASSSASRWEALEPIRQGVTRHLGDIGPGVANGLTLRHDHGSNYMSEDFQNEIRCLGIISSPAFVRQPEGNGVAERAIRTLKEQLLWVRYFTTVEELRQALAAFAELYNASWLRQRHGHKTPNQIRAEQKALETQAAMGVKMAA